MAPPDSKMSTWAKADILLKALLPIAVAAVGYFSTSYLAERQRDQANYLAERERAQTTAQFYTELLTKREEADSKLRQEVFKYIIDKFLAPQQDNLENQVLGLEMLAYNFHDSIALGPLFKAVYNKARVRSNSRALTARLETVSREIADRQIASLADPEFRWGAEIDAFAPFKKADFGSLTVFDKEISLPTQADVAAEKSKVHMTLFVLAVDRSRKSVQVQLVVESREPFQNILDATFWVSYFDLPMLDNTRFPNRQRLAVVLREFGADSAQLMIVLFPEERASLKEKPYLDDLINEMRRRYELEPNRRL